jgi:6-phosphofructokinase 1
LVGKVGHVVHCAADVAPATTPKVPVGQGAVHGAFAGFTGFTTGLVNTHYVYLPIETVIQAPRKVNPTGRRWNRLKTAISQPDLV